MADGDAAVIIAALGLPANLIEVPPGGIEIEIEMKMDIAIEGWREIEQFFDLRVGIGVHIGAAADQIAAVAQRRDQQLLGAGIVGQAFLGKDTDREINGPGVVALERLDGGKAAQSDARVDLDMGPHPRGAGNDGALDHAGAARIDILDREVALHGGDGANGFADAAMVMLAAAEQAGLVEVNVGIDKAGKHELAVDIDLGAFRIQPRRDRGNPAIGYPDIDGNGRRRRHGTAKDQVKGGFRGHWGCEFEDGSAKLSEARPKGSPRLCAGLSRNCSKYVQAI